jgi:hypothetical protein
MSTGHSAQEASRTCIITMVHGTWPRGFPRLFRAASPLWFNEGSVFRSRLEPELRKENIAATFRLFQWSGANSVFHRARAADELNGLLASDPDNANSIVIAHSHGGNVAFRAISKLGSRGARIHLITLATPFLQAFPTWSGPGFWDVYMPFFLVVTMGISIAMGTDLSTAPWPEHLGFGNWAAKVVFPSAVTSALLVRWIMNPSPPPAKRQSNRQTQKWACRPFRIAKAMNYDSAGPQAPNLLVIRGVDDEAALILAFGAIATRINRLALGAIWKLLLPLACLLIVGSMLEPPVLVLLGHSDVFGSESILWAHRALFYKINGWFYEATAVGALTLLAAPALFNTRFGREFLLGAIRCEVATDSAPDSTRSRIITLETPYKRFPWQPAEEPKQAPSSSSSMRHQIYNYPGCVPEIVKWINEHVR